ncbi:EF-hand domain-containing protein [Sulfurovum sp. ST-21]|uniref:EF-hand domain-containing protein n=1 Tax=Sulfurovum indicum TaxID=2779528 RepID=A0A7M1S1V8_9BACT|nr:EF-hand domain-containing protein [Sulfurovum indicum]QOR61423.1 EF-hand domain-containing protein [Sulfurovum indicum]
MKFTANSITIITLITLSCIEASSEKIDTRLLYKNKCKICHTTRLVTLQGKGNLTGPPADEVMLHVKEKYPEKEEAVKFMVDYIMDPSVTKALCASIDKFGLMPSMKNTITPNEAKAISEMMFDTFPREAFSKMEMQSRRGITFKTIDRNGDGSISPEEFKLFRAKRNNIDPESFRGNLYFQKVDLDHNGKMSKDEFQKMREGRMR